MVCHSLFSLLSVPPFSVPARTPNLSRNHPSRWLALKPEPRHCDPRHCDHPAATHTLAELASTGRGLAAKGGARKMAGTAALAAVGHGGCERLLGMAAAQRTLERFAIFLSGMLFVILRGYFMMPATMQWPYGLSGVPSSELLTMTAFLPAMRPLSITTTLPGLRNLVDFLASDIAAAMPVVRERVRREKGEARGLARGVLGVSSGALMPVWPPKRPMPRPGTPGTRQASQRTGQRCFTWRAGRHETRFFFSTLPRGKTVCNLGQSVCAIHWKDPPLEIGEGEGLSFQGPKVIHPKFLFIHQRLTPLLRAISAADPSDAGCAYG